jgi:ABC-type methionine transport system permease subunit
MNPIFSFLIVYLIGIVISFFLILVDESKYRNNIKLNELFEYLFLSFSSWIYVILYVVIELKIFEKIKELGNTRIDISKFKIKKK